MAGLRKAMERFGYLSPIVIDQNNKIADGEHRALIYKEFNIAEIPAYRVVFSDDSERRLLRQTMNKLRGQHDLRLDAEEMAQIYESQKLTDLSGLIAQQEHDLKQLMLRYKPDLPFGHEDDAQLDQLIDDELRKTAPDTKLGDIYQLGNHRLICADCTDKRSVDRLFEGKQCDLTVTSPPYDNLREYGGYNFDFEATAQILLNQTVDGGVVVWVIGDETVDGSESLTSFKQAIRFREIGFNVHDTMIYLKDGFRMPASNRYHQTFEYMFVLSKGQPKTFNPIIDRVIRNAGRSVRVTIRKRDGNIVKDWQSGRHCGDIGIRFNVWLIGTGYMRTSPDKIAYEHPAIFPLVLAKDHIISWSNSNNIVFDPFLGSGTTMIAAEQTNRICYGIEIDPHYCDIIVKRWESYTGKKAVLLTKTA